jgi:LacI family transcriptional regulator
MSSIKDVARVAGVSFTTVSHVLNGTRKVSEGARQRVLRAVNECGYVPSAVARSLRMAQTHNIGVLVPDISNPFCAEITLGVEEQASQSGYAVLLGNTGPQGVHQARQLEHLLGRRVDGVLLVAGVFGDDPQHPLEQVIRQRLAVSRTPLVMIDRDPVSVASDVLQADQFAAAHAATSYLLELGHRRIAFLSGPPDLAISHERLRGWQQAMLSAGLQASTTDVWTGDFSIESGFQQGVRCLQRAGVTAILAANDMMALGVLRAAASLGVAVPGALSVMGMDGITMGEYSSPSLTTVGASLRAVGRQAAQMLLDRMAQPQGPQRTERRSFDLMVRESTGPVPAGDAVANGQGVT